MRRDAYVIALIRKFLLLTAHCRGAIHRRTMGGRYDYTPGEFREIRIRWSLDNDLSLFKPCYNIALGKDVPVIVWEGEHNQIKLMPWGLVPSWPKDPSIGNRMINARVDAGK